MESNPHDSGECRCVVQMFAPGEPSSKQRTIILIQMVKDTTDAVNEQLASLAGRRRRGFRNAGRALSSVASFSSRRGQAAEAALLAVTATVKIPEASENIWDLGIGVLPSTSTTSIRFGSLPFHPSLLCFMSCCLYHFERLCHLQNRPFKRSTSLNSCF